MTEIKALNTQEKSTTLSQASLQDLAAKLDGDVILTSDKGYDNTRKIWNDMIDRKPAFIVQCRSDSDIIEAVKFAKQNDLLLSVRGAGHNIAGRALKDNVMLIDLILMKDVQVDPKAQTAVVSPGATLGDIDKATQAFGLALPVGINSTTGISGLTLGGGFGWLSRKYGMTIDNLLSAEVITTAGENIKCDRDHHADLFWAICGGGGSFGIVSSFKFKLHKVGPEVMAGPLIFTVKDAKKVLQNYRDYCRTAPNEMSAWAVLRKAPPFPFLDAVYHGQPVVVIVGMYSGSVEEGEKEFANLRKIGTPLADASGPHKFSEFQQAFDPLLTPGVRNYWKTNNFLEMPDALIDTMIDFLHTMPSDHSEIFFAQMGGASNDVEKKATAYPHRDTQFIMNVHTRWEEPEQDHTCIQWARDFYKTTKDFGTGGAYINFVSEGDDVLESLYGENIKRLEAIKNKYDPDNILRANLAVQGK